MVPEMLLLGQKTQAEQPQLPQLLHHPVGDAVTGKSELTEPQYLHIHYRRYVGAAVTNQAADYEVPTLPMVLSVVCTHALLPESARADGGWVVQPGV